MDWVGCSQSKFTKALAEKLKMIHMMAKESVKHYGLFLVRIAHKQSHSIYDLNYQRKEISEELYEFCFEQGYANRNLIAKCKKGMPRASNMKMYSKDDDVLNMKNMGDEIDEEEGDDGDKLTMRETSLQN